MSCSSGSMPNSRRTMKLILTLLALTPASSSPYHSAHSTPLCVTPGQRFQTSTQTSSRRHLHFPREYGWTCKTEKEKGDEFPTTSLKGQNPLRSVIYHLIAVVLFMCRRHHQKTFPGSDKSSRGSFTNSADSNSSTLIDSAKSTPSTYEYSELQKKAGQE